MIDFQLQLRPDLDILSVGETFWLYRLREPSASRHERGRRNDGITQREAARRLGVSLWTYQQLESGEKAELAATLLPKVAGAPPNAYECCLLARHRSEVNMLELADMLAVSAEWLLQMERKADLRLVSFWKDMGYRGFPSSN